MSNQIPKHPPVEEELWPTFYQILKKIDAEYQKHTRKNNKPKASRESTVPNGTEKNGQQSNTSASFPEELSYADMLEGVNTRIAPHPLYMNKEFERILVDREELRYRQQQYRELRKVLHNLKHENQLPGQPDDTDLTLVLDLDHTLIHTTELNSKTTSFAVDFMAEYRARNPMHPVFSLEKLHFADETLSDELIESVPHVLVYRKSKFADGGDDTTAGNGSNAHASESKTASKEMSSSIPPIVPPDKEPQLFAANPNRVRRASEVPQAIAEVLPQMMREDLAGLSPEMYKFRWIMFRPGVFRFLRQIVRYNEHVRAYNLSLLQKYPNIARDRLSGNRNDTGDKAFKPSIHLALYTLSSKHYADAITNMLEARIGCPSGTLFGTRVIARETNNQTERTLLYALSSADIVRFIAEDHPKEVDELATSLLDQTFSVRYKSEKEADLEDVQKSKVANPEFEKDAGASDQLEQSEDESPIAAQNGHDETKLKSKLSASHPSYPAVFNFFRSFAMRIMAMRMIDFCKEYVVQKHSQTILAERLHEIINDFDHADWALSADQVARHIQTAAVATVNLGAEFLSADRARSMQLSELEKMLSSKNIQELALLLGAQSIPSPFTFKTLKASQLTGDDRKETRIPSADETRCKVADSDDCNLVCPPLVQEQIEGLINTCLGGRPLIDPFTAQVNRDEQGTVMINGYKQSEKESNELHQSFLAARSAVASIWIAGLQQFDHLAHVVRGRFETALQAAFNELAGRISGTHDLLNKKHAKVLSPLIYADREGGLRFAVSSLQKGLRANRLRPSRSIIIDDNRDKVWNDGDARSNLIQITQFMPFPASHDITDEEYAKAVIAAVDYQMASGYSAEFSDFVSISRCLDVVLYRLWQASKIPPGDIDAHALLYYDYELESTRQQLQQQQSVISTQGLQSLNGIRLSGPSADFTQGSRHITSPSSALLTISPNQQPAHSSLVHHQQLLQLQQQQLQQAFNTAVAADERTNVVVAPRNIYSSRYVHHAVVTPETHRRAHAALVKNIRKVTKSNSIGKQVDASSLDDVQEAEDENYPVVILRSYAPEISAFSSSSAATSSMTSSAATAFWGNRTSMTSNHESSTDKAPERLPDITLEVQSNSTPTVSLPPISNLDNNFEPFTTGERLCAFQIPEAAEDVGSMSSPNPSSSSASSNSTESSKSFSSVLSPFSIVPHFAKLKHRFKQQPSTEPPQDLSCITASNSTDKKSSCFKEARDIMQPVSLGKVEHTSSQFSELFQSLIPPPFASDSESLFDSIPVSRDVRVLLYHFSQAFPNRLPVTIVPSLALTSLEAIDEAQTSALVAISRDPTLAPASHAPTTTYIPPYLFAPLKHRGVLVCRHAISSPSISTSVVDSKRVDGLAKKEATSKINVSDEKLVVDEQR